MTHHSTNIHEVSDGQLPTLAEAQRQACIVISGDIASSIRAMLDRGELAVVNGRIVVSSKL